MKIFSCYNVPVFDKKGDVVMNFRDRFIRFRNVFGEYLVLAGAILFATSLYDPAGMEEYIGFAGACLLLGLIVLIAKVFGVPIFNDHHHDK